MNKLAIGKVALSLLGVVLTVGSTLVNDKVKDSKIEETIAKKVQEALSEQAKES